MLRSEIAQRSLFRIFCFLASLLLHVGGLYLLVTAKFTYKIYDFDRSVRNVVLFPFDEVYLPGNYARIIRDQAGIGEEPFMGPVVDVERAQVEEEGGGEPGAGTEAEGRVPAAQQQQEGSPGGAQRGGDFSLSVPRGAQNLPLEKDLDLSRRQKSPSVGTGPYTGKENIPDADLSRHVPSDVSTGRLLKNNPFLAGRRSGKRTQVGGVTFNVEDYDLEPWAKLVVDRIQGNWMLYPYPEDFAAAKVRISAIIEKNGEISFMDLVETSEQDALDQAALKALKLSLPFPGLPGDFPQKNLEAVFLFQYEKK